VLNPDELTITILVRPQPKVKYTQSPFLYLQAAGSTGEDGSAKGVHLRWLFKNALGDNHLPKGNLAANTTGFNKADDFVKICKVPYEKQQITIDFNDTPAFIYQRSRFGFVFLRRQPFWVYEIEGNRYVIYFRNVSQYYNSLRTIDPETNPKEFLQSYGNNLIEVVTVYSLAFSAEFIVENSLPSSLLQTELIGSEEKLFGDKKQGVIARKTFESNQFSSTYQLAEDIKTIRFKPNACLVTGIKIELYSTIVTKADKEKLWKDLGDYALTTTNTTAYKYLEPKVGLIDGKWPRFNEGDFVKLQNYKDKWGKNSTDKFEKNIKQIVADYIRLSNDQTNPSGKEAISFSDDAADAKDIAYLDILNIAAADYHVARMLGLGCFDLDLNTANQKFVYAIKYTTKNKIDNYQYADKNYTVDHIYTSLPTSNTDQRLPLPFELQKLRPGAPTGESFAEQLDDDGNVISVDPTMSLADKDGYSKQGKSRYISLYAAEDEEDELLLNFYEKTKQFNSSEYTVPVLGGIERKVEELEGNSVWKPGDTPWDKPELSITQAYFNTNNTPEILPLGIPDKGYPLYVHRQTQEGIYYYGTYGINWFSRVSPIKKALSIKTEFVPDNDLLPPYNINALHIVEERPLLLTSTSEQELLGDLLKNEAKKDKTLVRLAFQYNTTQELQSYKITDRLKLEAEEKLKGKVWPNDNVLLHEDAIFKDEKEIFADKVEIFFRNEIPRNIRGKIVSIADHPSDVRISVITTTKYQVNSSSNPEEDDFEYLTPELPTGATSQNFEGGVFTTNGNNFFIESITGAPNNVVINVFKKESDDSIQTDIIPRDDVALEGPVLNGDNLFMAIENMSDPNSWENKGTNPSTFIIDVATNETNSIHREIIVNNEGPDDEKEEILEKTRGYWANTIITEELEVIEISEDGTEKKAHRGLYKIAFPFKMPQHPQSVPDSKGNFVEWYGGMVRIHTKNDLEGPRKNLTVLRIENVGSTTKNVEIYAVDESFTTVTKDDDGNIIPNDTISIGNNVEVNFYPGYKAYLYADPVLNLTDDSIEPKGEEDIKYSVFGLRSRDLDGERTYKREYTSPVSTPALMFVHKITDPLVPEQPKGALYATQPDSFGKATYTLTSEFKHRPYGVLYYRSNDRSILGALYTDATVNTIIEKLESFNPDVFYTNRWDELLGFDYGKTFSVYPKTANGYRFPKPDKPSFFKLINGDIAAYNKEYKKNRKPINEATFDLTTLVIPKISDELPAKTVTEYVRVAIMNSFVSLTEAPLLYDYIKTDNKYQPIAKRQVLRDRDGNLLKPGTFPYDIAPMAKRIAGRKSYDDVLFTDFGLDGTSKNTYFYTSREVGSTTQLGDFSKVKGPIKLVNTKAPENPEIKRVLPILASSEFEFVQVPLEFVDVENIEISETNRFINTSPIEWGAGVASKQILRGNSYVTFRAEANTEAMIGFSSFNNSSHFNSIQFALSLKSNGKLHIFENGEDLGEVGSYTVESNFKIEVKGNTVIFSRDEVILYTETLIKASDFILDIALNSNATIYDIALFSIAPTYTKEELVGDSIPLTFAAQEFIQIKNNVISKNAGINGDAWDAGAYSVEYMPYYGSLSFKVKANTNVIVGLADDTLNQDSTDKIDYSLQANDDGYLYVCLNGSHITGRCVQYNENSLLEIERRNNYLIFKKDQRPFYELPLHSNIPLFVDFSMYSGDSELIDLQMKSTQELVKDIAVDELNPALSFEVNAYQSDQRIRKLNLYRTTRPENTLSVRTMDLVNSVDLVLTNQLESNIITIKDEFLDLEFVPYSDPLYYRVTVSREVEYAKPKIEETDPTILLAEYKPSNPSKLLVSSIVESKSPYAPEVTYGFDTLANNDTVIDNIILKWDKTVHNGKYHIYNMNTQGNWVKIHEIISNDDEIQLFLGETDLENILQIKDVEGALKYYHFKVDAENSAGMLNTKSKIVTIPSDAGVTSLEGIGSMIIENTNLVR